MCSKDKENPLSDLNYLTPLIRRAGSIRKKLNSAYRLLQGIMRNDLTRPYLFHRSGSNFGEYVLSHSMPDVVAQMKVGLDTQSQRRLDLALRRIVNCPDEEYAESFLFFPSRFYTDSAEMQEIAEERKITEWQKLKGQIGDAGCLYHKHGLAYLGTQALDYVRGRDCFDLGAFHGESALSLAECGFRKIYSFEISTHNAEIFRNNTAALWNRYEISNKPDIELFLLALSDRIGTLHFHDTGNASSNLYRAGDSEIGITTLDRFAKEHQCNIGFLKADIEGEEMPMLKGGKHTICRDRPIMAISIYHNAEQFFEIKPMIESWNIGYRFALRQHGRYLPNPIGEMTLLAYPKQLARVPIAE
jgi:FkbM family methyltransferase